MSATWVIAWREANSILHQRRMLVFAVGFGVIIPLFAGGVFIGVIARLSSVIGLGNVGHLHASLRVTGVKGLTQSLLVWLGIFPILFSAQFAAIAFAAERERRSLPALLATPASLGAIITGKLLASLAPGLITVVASYSVYVSSVEAATSEAASWLPIETVVAAGLFLAALSLLVNGAALLISTRSRTVVGASSTVTFVSLPVSIATALFALALSTLPAIAVVGAAVAVAGLAALVVYAGAVFWRRGEILAN